MINFSRIFNCLSLILLISLSCVPGRKNEALKPLFVEAREWSKINGVAHYSEWRKYPVVTLGALSGFTPQTEIRESRYGGDPSHPFRKTGFFYSMKSVGRWWIVDPDGNGTLNIGLNGIRPGSSQRNEQALIRKYGTEQNWITSTHKEIENIGFNGAGCWSEVPLIKYSNRNDSTPLCYTMILNFFSGYSRQIKKQHPEWPYFSVFSKEFEQYVDVQAKKALDTKEDPDLLGYFSDNELTFSTNTLDDYLAVTDSLDPNYHAAISWLKDNGLSREKINDTTREMFLGAVAERYYSVVLKAIRKYDPNHMYLGSRLHGKPKHNQWIIKAAGKYSDILSINYYGQWEPVAKHFREWSEWADKPIIITEFYTKGDDSGMPNMSGAGWRVKTQNERGVFYENFCLKLLQMKNCVGWNWFRYMDNDPTDSTADISNSDSNKGLVNNFYEYYQPLADHMHLLNVNRYNLIRYFDK